MELYLQLTEHCNMTCKHCCVSALYGGKAKFMTDEVFRKALGIAENFQSSVTLGGGEPSLHPKILDWVMEAALATLETSIDRDGPAVLVVTNGKKTDVALKLAKLGHLGIIQADLSQDEWHDPISEKVVKEFTRYNKNHWTRGHSGIRNVTGGVKEQGRAVENGVADMSGCACGALFIKPNGDFYPCGCQKTKLGNILTDEIPEFLFNYSGECESEILELQENKEFAAV